MMPVFTEVRSGTTTLLFAALLVLGLSVPSPVQAQFQQRKIASDSYGDVVTADVDEDGHPDILTSNYDLTEEGTVVLGGSSDTEEKDIAISWFENEMGKGEADSDGFGSEQIIVKLRELSSAHAGDFDGDGDVDALSVTPDNGEIAWYENRVGESGADADGFGEQRLITTDARGAASVQVSDLDGNGRVDVLAPSEVAMRMTDKADWFENRIGDADADGERFRDSTLVFSEPPKAITTADVDGEGGEDLFFRFADRVAWAKIQSGTSGTGVTGFRDSQTITADEIEPKIIHAVDLDGDGDPDLLLGTVDEVAWYENQVGERGADADGFGPKQVLFSEVRRCSLYEKAQHSVHCNVFSADVDGDGDEDALTAFEDRIAWYENQIDENGADTSGFGPQRVVATHEVKSIHAADVDSDGDDDILASWDDGIVWHESQVDRAERPGAVAYRKAESAYEDGQWEDALTHLDRAEEILSGGSGSTVDSLRGRVPVLRAKTLLRVVEASYNNVGLTHENTDDLDSLRAILARQDGPQVDTLQARRFALVARIRHEEEDLGRAQRAHVKMTATGAVPPDLAEKMAAHRRKVEAALMGDLPPSVRESVRAAASMDTLDLSDRDLVGLPDSIRRIRSLQRVDLSGNKLTSLPEGIRQWSRVQELDLSDNALSELPGSLGRLTDLRKLDVSSNELTELPSTVWQLPNLQWLDLSGNWWINNPRDIQGVGKLADLKRLDVSQLGLSELPESIGQLSRLRRLNVSGNELTEFPSFISKLSNLRQLDLSDNGIKRLPQSIGELTSLRRLNASRNALSDLPSTIGQLANLRQLDLSGNGNATGLEAGGLNVLPKSIGDLANLRRLDVSRNALTELPSTTDQLSNLRRLDLSNNGLTSLPQDIGQLTRLRRLEVAGNLSDRGLSDLPSSIEGLTSLRRLEIPGNSLSDLPSRIEQLTNLRRLNLSYNEFEDLPSSVGQFPHLSRLSVSRSLVPSDSQKTRLESLLPDSTSIVYSVPLTNETEYRWLQTSRLLVPLGNRRRNPLERFLNSITDVIARRDTLTAKRGPAPSEAFSLSELKDQLGTMADIEPTDANYVRIDYQFGVADRGFEEKLQAIHFLYRSGPEQAFVPVLYLNGQQQWVQSVLRTVFRGHRPHGAVSFADVMRFAEMNEEGTIVQIGGRDVRDDTRAEREAFVQRILRRISESR